MINTPISPNLLSFLPMLYVAWADDILTTAEIERLQTKIQQQNWLNSQEKQTLYQWLHPTETPSPQTLNEWLRLIQTAATKMSEHERKSLAELGLEMAQISTGNEVAPDKLAEEYKALLEIEEALGIDSHEASRELMASQGIPVERLDEASFSEKEMQQFLDADQYDFRQKVKSLLNDSAFELEIISDKDQYREVVLKWCQLLADKGWGALSYPESCGGKNEMRAYVALFETMGYHDLSLAIKFGVQFGLFGMSVQALGTEYHHQKFLTKIGTLELPGCFAMTEDGHGSNVRDIETTATYDPGKRRVYYSYSY